MSQLQTDLSILPEPESPAPYGCSRRHFMRTACASALLASVGVTLSACDSAAADDGDGNGGGGTGDGVTISGNTITLDLTKSGAAPLATADGFLRIASAGVIAVNAGGTIRAFTDTCTHEGNKITTFDNGAFRCPAHGSRFSTDGERLSGPAPEGSRLTEYAVVRDGNLVTITKG